MKTVYSKAFALLYLLLITLIPAAFAQPCTCSGGTKPDSLKYRVELNGLTTYTSFSFPKFDPALGTLSCMRMEDTVNATMGFELINRVDSRFDYNMNANITATVAGPSGFVASANYVATFGPYDLGAAGIDPDTSVVVGPVTIFSNRRMVRNQTSGLANYIGTGTVPFTFDLSGPVWPAPSSGNYAANVQTVGDVKVNLTYYYCPSAVLAVNIKQFMVQKKGEKAFISWQSQLAQNIRQYVLEFSTDGRNFQPFVTVQGDGKESQTFEYIHDLTDKKGNHLYYRILQKDAQGKSMYSTIRAIALTEKAPMQVSAYPNPVQDQLQLGFDRPVNGLFLVEVYSLGGQPLYRREIRMVNSQVIPINLGLKPASGGYFAKITQQQGGQFQIVPFLVR
jgi:hypothetical protein